MEQDNQDDLRDTEFNKDDDLPDAFPNDLTDEIVIEEADVLEIKMLHESIISENGSIENVNKSEVLSKLFIFVGKYKDRLALRSRTARLWLQYLEYVAIAKNFIRAERTGNWHLHLVSTSQMLKALKGLNYPKSTRMYLQMMLELPDKYLDLYEKFSTEGYHTPRRSHHF